MPRKTDKPASKTDKTPRYGVVAEGYCLFWPTLSGEKRGGAGTVVPFDDPMVNTELLTQEQRNKFRLLISDQRFKLVAAPEGSAPAGCPLPRMMRIYRELGYDGVPAGEAAGGVPAQAGGQRTRQHTPVTTPPVVD